MKFYSRERGAAVAMRCPECGSSRRLSVECAVVYHLEEDGEVGDAAGEACYGPDSWTVCDDCGHESTFSSFEVSE